MAMAMRVLRRTAPANLPRLAVAARHLRTSAPASSTGWSARSSAWEAPQDGLGIS